MNADVLKNITKGVYTTPKLVVRSTIAQVIGILFLFMALVIIIESSHLLAGFIPLLLAFLFLSEGTIFILDQKTYSYSRLKRFLCIRFNTVTVNLKGMNGYVALIASKDELTGIDRNTSLFVTYDVRYCLDDGHVISVFSSTSQHSALKVALFFAKHLGVPVRETLRER